MIEWTEKSRVNKIKLYKVVFPKMGQFNGIMCCKNSYFMVFLSLDDTLPNFNNLL